jgi:hypothetical protein
VNPAFDPRLVYSHNVAIKDSFMVIIASADGCKSLTYHRPIGKTPYDRNSEWVCSETNGISDLLQRAEDPREASYRLVDREILNKAVVEAKGFGITFGNEGRLVYPSGVERNIALNEARKSRAKSQIDPKPDILSFLKEDDQKAEKLLREFYESPEAKELLAESNPRPTYETKGGARGDIAQVPNLLLSDLSRREAIDTMLKLLTAAPGYTLSYDIEEDAAVHPSAPSEEKDGSARLPRKARETRVGLRSRTAIGRALEKRRAKKKVKKPSTKPSVQTKA